MNKLEKNLGSLFGLLIGHLAAGEGSLGAWCDRTQVRLLYSFTIDSGREDLVYNTLHKESNPTCKKYQQKYKEY